MIDGEPIVAGSLRSDKRVRRRRAFVVARDTGREFLLWLGKLLATSVGTAALLWVVLLIASVATVKVENRSPDTIVGGEFRGGDRVYRIRRLPPGASQRFWFVTGHEGSYGATVELASGRALSGGNGYIAWPYFVDEQIRIHSTTVEVIETSDRAR